MVRLCFFVLEKYTKQRYILFLARKIFSFTGACENPPPHSSSRTLLSLYTNELLQFFIVLVLFSVDFIMRVQSPTTIGEFRINRDVPF